MTRKTNYERLIKALRREGEPDYVPLIELGIAPSIKEKLLGKPANFPEDEITLMRRYGYDFVKVQPKCDFNPGKIKAQGAGSFGGYKEDGINWASEHEGVITDDESFERYIFAKPEDISYERFEQIAKVLPDDMCVIGQYGDIFTMAWEMMGFENFSMAIFENPDLIGKLFSKLGPTVFAMFENMVQMDVVKVLWYSDDIAYDTSLMISPAVIREHLFPWIKKIGDLAKKYNKPFIYHTDGRLWDVFDDIVDCGVNAIHPIEPKAMDIVEVKKKMGNKLCVCGNIDMAYTLTRGTPEEVDAEVKERIRTVAPGGGYLVSSSNSIADYVKPENFIAMTEAVKKYGKYPIDL